MSVEFSWLGVILIPAGFGLLALRRDLLFATLVWTVPLYNTTVLSIGLGIGFPLRTPHFFLILLGLKQFLDGVQGESIYVPYTREVQMLLAYFAIATASIFMPLFLSGTVLIHPFETGGFSPRFLRPLRFGVHNLTQLLYHAFFVAGILTLVSEISTTERIRRSLAILARASVLVIASGLVFQLVVLMGKPHLVRIIFEFAGVQTVKYDSTLGFLPRMYTFAGEPGGPTGNLLVAVLGITAIPLTLDRDVFLHRAELIALAGLALLTLILSTSTRGYIGFALLALAAIWMEWTSEKTKYHFTKAVVALTAVPMVLVILDPLINTGVSELILAQIEKLTLQDGSGTKRLALGIHAFTLFVESPVLGVGIGSTRFPSGVLLNLMASVGILGTAAFVVANVAPMAKQIRLRYETPSGFHETVAIVLFVTLFPILTLIFFVDTWGGMLYPWYWLLLAIAISLYHIGDEEP